jgi:hypothetical protein
VEQADARVARPSHHKRRPEQPAPQHLFAVVRGWSAQGEQDLHLEASKQSKARTAHVVISFGCLPLLPPDSQPNRDLPPLVVWVVRVWEPEPKDGHRAAGVDSVDFASHPDGRARLGAG